MLTLLIALLALVGLGAIIFFVFVLVGSRSRRRSRDELLVEVEALRALGELSSAAWAAARRMFLEAMQHLRKR